MSFWKQKMLIQNIGINWGGYFVQKRNSNINEDTIKSLKLPREITNKRGGKIHTEFTSYSCKKLKINTGGSYLEK